MEKLTNTVSLNHTAKLRGRDGLKVLSGIPSKLNDFPMVNKLHGKWPCVVHDATLMEVKRHGQEGYG